VLQHIHETIQPVVNREVIQPNVVHTTVPIHEVHHNKATHHETTALPTMTMDEFKHKGGVLSGREERYDEFEGVPKNIGGGTVGGFGHTRDTAHEGHHVGSEHHQHGDFNNTPNHHSTGLAGTGAAASGLTGSHSTHASRDPSGNVARESTLSNTTTGNTGRHVGTDGPIGSSGHRDGTDLPKALTEDKSRANLSSDHHDGTSKSKPGLMAKLNPKVDADGDGKAGFMK
jgi:hypothetical protein